MPTHLSPTDDVQSAFDEARAGDCVVLTAGEYYMKGPLVLTGRHRGLTVEGDGEATLFGGRRITDWRPDGERLWAAELPDVAEGRWDFRMLRVNGRLCPRARLPEEGYFEHRSEFPVRWMSTTGGGWERKPTRRELTELVYNPDDLGSWLEPANAELTIYHSWDESLVGVESIDPDNNLITFRNEATHPPGSFREHRYCVWNVREGMRRPGQWYLDRAAGKVVYWPLPGEDIRQIHAVAPTLDSVVRIEGAEEEPVEGVTLRGLRISVTNVPLMSGGFGARRPPGAVELTHTRDCRLRVLHISEVAGQGIKAGECRGLRVDRCDVADTGAAGIIVGGRTCCVSDCHVHHVGRLYPSAIAISMGGGTHLVSHNEVHDTPYSGITASGTGHSIEHNHIYRVMQTMSDGAGIYITFCKRVALRGNFVHDVHDRGHGGASAYYLDEQAENCLVEQNLAVRVPWMTHHHMARRNTLRHNVLTSERGGLITLPKSCDYTFEGNVFYADDDIVIRNFAAISAFEDNILFSRTGDIQVENLNGYKATDRQPLPAGGSMNADPCFIDPDAGDFRFRPDAPARELGIPSISVTGVGPRPGLIPSTPEEDTEVCDN